MISISVIIPTWNRRKYIGQSIDSVLETKGYEPKKHEIIVVDDGSEDDTVKYLRKNYKRHITLVTLPHTGRPAVVRNAGLAKAKGKYVAFQDADDIWINRDMDKLIEHFKDPGVSLSYANAVYVGPDNNPLDGKLLVNPETAVAGYAFIKKASKLPTATPTSTVVVRRADLIKLGNFNEKLIIATDTDMWMRIATLGNYAYRDEVEAHIRRDGHNISSTPEEEGDKALFKHELSRIDMFRHILKETKLTATEKAVLRYRIAELHLYVDEVCRRMGKQSPFDVKQITLPKKPAELKEIDDKLEGSLFHKLDRALKKILLRVSPRLYNVLRKTVKKAVQPFRTL